MNDSTATKTGNSRWVKNQPSSVPCCRDHWWTECPWSCWLGTGEGMGWTSKTSVISGDFFRDFWGFLLGFLGICMDFWDDTWGFLGWFLGFLGYTWEFLGISGMRPGDFWGVGDQLLTGCWPGKLRLTISDATKLNRGFYSLETCDPPRTWGYHAAWKGRGIPIWVL